jgi:hypothetical protein
MDRFFGCIYLILNVYFLTAALGFKPFGPICRAEQQDLTGAMITEPNWRPGAGYGINSALLQSWHQ